MAGPQHRTPEYRRAYRALRAAQSAGQWLVCAEPVCVMGSRDIAPWMPAHVCHDPTGAVIIGYGHRRCNITEVNERRAAGGQVAYPRSRRPCVDCGKTCGGTRCAACRQAYLEAKRAAKGHRPRKTSRCPDCGAQSYRNGARCKACSDRRAADYMREYMRTRYRRKVGIADDAPLYPKRLAL